MTEMYERMEQVPSMDPDCRQTQRDQHIIMEVKATIAKAIMRDTFVAATFLDRDPQFLSQHNEGLQAHSNNSNKHALFRNNTNQLSYFVKSPSTKGIYMNTIDNLEASIKAQVSSKASQFRIQRMPIRFKQLKKMKVIRNFYRPGGVFKDFREETRAMLDRAFTIDKQFLKTPKFIKDKVDLENIEQVLRRHFRQLKDQFTYQIAASGAKQYPVIGWLDYVDQCQKWRILGLNLTS